MFFQNQLVISFIPFAGIEILQELFNNCRATRKCILRVRHPKHLVLDTTCDTVNNNGKCEAKGLMGWSRSRKRGWGLEWRVRALLNSKKSCWQIDMWWSHGWQQKADTYLTQITRDNPGQWMGMGWGWGDATGRMSLNRCWAPPPVCRALFALPTHRAYQSICPFFFASCFIIDKWFCLVLCADTHCSEYISVYIDVMRTLGPLTV